MYSIGMILNSSVNEGFLHDEHSKLSLLRISANANDLVLPGCDRGGSM